MADRLRPLCVDLDGTLLRTDLLWESVARLAKAAPWLLVMLPVWAARGRAHLKRQLSERVALDAATLPFHPTFLEYLRTEKRRGRRLFLVTASDEKLAAAVAAHCGFFDDVIASDGRTNLRGAAKAATLVARFGERGYDYAGDSSVDVPVWARAAGSIVVGNDRGLKRAASAEAPLCAEFSGRSHLARSLVRVLRPHQWVKNLIVLVPLITSHQLARRGPLEAGCLAFAAFCLCASGVYVLNDLLDVEADRRHATKRRRPFAAGDLPLAWAFGLGPLLLALGLTAAAALSLAFAGMVLLYVLLAFAYAWQLKKVVLVDVFVLTALYTIRLVAGHVATGVEFSEWLLAFSMFIFLSLALVKRHQEVQRLRGVAAESVAGRGYTRRDLELLTPLGTASGYLSILILALYVTSEKVRLLYHRPILLLLICPLMLYWISRVWLVTHRGEMNDDPVVFALQDKVSYLVGLLSLAIVWLAT